MKPIFVLASDERNAMPLTTAMRSVVETNRYGWPLEFYILDGAISERTREKVLLSLPPGSAQIHWMSVDPSLFSGCGQCAAGGHLSYMAYARLLIPEVLPKAISRVLYLDTDIITTGDLRPLWETDLHGALLGAVTDTNMAEALEQGRISSDDVPRVTDYFNSGVLLLDLKAWREKAVAERALQYLKSHPRSLYPDQDALNVVCDNLWWKLDPRWNFQGHLRTRISEIQPERRPAIIHFVTNVKPWDAGMLSVNASFYDSYRKRTMFARSVPEQISDSLHRLWSDAKRFLKMQPFIRSIVQKVGRCRVGEMHIRRMANSRGGRGEEVLASGE